MEKLFQDLYEKYHRDVYQFLFYLVKNKEQAEDLVQEVYIKALKSYGGFQGNSSEKTWLFSIARHTAIDWFRKQKRQKRSWADFIDWKEQTIEWRDHEPLPDEIAERNEETKHLYNVLKKCPVNHQLVLVLRFIQSYSIKESAEILGWSESKVKTTQHRALKALREQMEEESRRREAGDYDELKVR
ncbi:RNA polymerase sigma factor SigX [Bacillus marinisedimentorum]|uniref:RNA polymerase sigma factor SigX n=1 Tax=Bacillus marinisedimentorum TaxID=1821260 RepID=UPI0007E1923F|nr:RNA polymerase sigma factor SigX [Bacillus marinisedimentorum]